MNYKLLQKQILESDTSKVVFVLELSNCCPMRCAYCFYGYDLKKKIELNLEDSKLFSFLKNISLQKQVSIDIQYDGNFKKLKEFVYALFKFDINNIELTIQSSGCGVTKEFINFVKDLGISVAYSFDGFYTGFRKNDISKKAMELSNKMNLSFGIITVVSKENENRLFSDFKRLIKNYKYFRGIYYNHIYTANLEILPDPNILVKEYISIYNYIIRNNISINFNPYLSNLRRKYFKFAELCDDGGCGGFKRMFAIGCNNKIYGCDSLIKTYTPANNCLQIRKNLLKEVTKLKTKLKCKSCDYNGVCESFCIGKYKSIGSNFKFLKKLCEYNFAVCESMKDIPKNQAFIFMYNPNKDAKQPITSNINKLSKITKKNINYIRRSILEIKDGKTVANLSKLLQIINNISEINSPKFMNLQELNKKEIKEKTYYSIISETYKQKITNKVINDIFVSDKLFYNLIVENEYFYNVCLFLINSFQITDKHYFDLFQAYMNYKSRMFYIFDLQKITTGSKIKKKIINNQINNFELINGKFIDLINLVGCKLVFDITTLEYQYINLKLNPKLDFFNYYKVGYYSGTFNKKEYKLIIDSELKQYNNNKWGTDEK